MARVTPWRVITSERLRADRWISLRADHCVTAEGVEVAPYYVLEYPDWVHVVAIDQQARVLFVEQYRHGAGVITLELPAGRMDAGEAPTDTAARELREETGWAADDLRLLGASHVNPASHTNCVHTVLASAVTWAGPPLDDPRERLAARWLAAEAAFALAIDGQLPAMQAASLLSAFRHLDWLQFTAPPATDPGALR
jgi:8-oxo-dGTP pyrophosphatase MutT (NUDIX family)